MKDSQNLRKLSVSLLLLFGWMSCCMAAMTGFTVHTLRSIQHDQIAHADSFVPAKRLSARFEREILNARIFFIYFVTIQKPNSLESGWVRYHNAEAAVHDLGVLVNKEDDLSNLRAPEAKLQADIDTYGITLAQVLAMVKGGERRGPHYDAMVQLWAAKGATMVGDAGAFESLCFRSGEANSQDIADALGNGQTWTELLFGGSFLISLGVTLALLRRTRRILDGPPAPLASPGFGNPAKVF